MTDLVVCDLDGTLLRSDVTLSPFARDGLNTLISAGVSVTVTGARSLPAIRALLPGVDLTLPVVELNGAFVSDVHTPPNAAKITAALRPYQRRPPDKPPILASADDHVICAHTTT